MIKNYYVTCSDCGADVYLTSPKPRLAFCRGCQNARAIKRRRQEQAQASRRRAAYLTRLGSVI